MWIKENVLFSLHASCFRVKKNKMRNMLTFQQQQRATSPNEHTWKAKYYNSPPTPLSLRKWLSPCRT